MQTKKPQKYIYIDQKLEEKIRIVSRGIRFFNDLSPTTVSKDNYEEKFEKFIELKKAFCDAAHEMWDQEENYFYSFFRWPKGWNLSIFITCAFQIKNIGQHYFNYQPKDVYTDVIEPFAQLYQEKLLGKANRKLPDIVLEDKPPSFISTASKFLYAPLKFLTISHPLPTGVVVGSALTFLAHKNELVLKAEYERTSNYLSSFWQQAKKLQLPPLPELSIANLFKDNISYYYLISGLYLFGYFVHSLSNSTPTPAPKISLAESISRALEKLDEHKEYELINKI